MANTSLFMLSQVAKHKSRNDCWLVIDGQVLNVTRFLEEHPGGDVVILEVAGKDVTKEFQLPDSKAAWNLLLKYHVGALEGYTFQENNDGKQAPATTFKETRKQMTAVMVKDDSTQKYVPFLELFVPFLVAGSYFCY